jgi:hypothetical protein
LLCNQLPVTGYDLITSPAFIVIKAASEFKDKTTAINQLWQTNFTYFKIIGWGGFISARSWMITAATLSRGNSAQTCGHKT